MCLIFIQKDCNYHNKTVYQKVTVEDAVHVVSDTLLFGEHRAMTGAEMFIMWHNYPLDRKEVLRWEPHFTLCGSRFTSIINILYNIRKTLWLKTSEISQNPAE